MCLILLGSGYKEGPDQIELQEPMQFSVCTEQEELLPLLVSKLKDHISKVSIEY